MAYDHELAARIRGIVGRKKGVTEKEMFGGVAFLLEGKMFVGIVKDDLMVRLDPDDWEKELARAHARPMDFAGKPMKGYVYVAPAGLRKDEALAAYVTRAAEFVATLPAKKPKAKPAKPAKPAKKR
jgi:TfoX/Sxy family transcriptional regulator of competence genes